MNTLYIFGAKYLFFASFILYAWWLWNQPQKRRIYAIFYTLLSSVLAYALAKIAGHFYYDPRPFVSDGIVPLISHAPDNGFPSDHALLVSTIAASITFLDIRKSVWFWIIAIVVAISRVGIGVHHPIDVTASAAIAAISAYIVHWIAQWYTRRHG